jgi:ring-1,2-phenylacetyl-CoA epoxidase subunit PaaD
MREPERTTGTVSDTTDTTARVAAVWRILETVPDPEIPVLSVVDLGIVRDVRFDGDTLVVTITPTYSGCPATQVIEADIRRAIERSGHTTFDVVTVLSPPWTTDWLSAAGREKLRAFGIAPPAETSGSTRARYGAPPASGSPRCGSERTTRISEYGSTPCKAHYRCDDCLEPFDYFKCL